MTSQDSSSPNSVALVLREVSTAGVDMIVSSREPGSRIGRYILDGPMEDAGVGALYAAHDNKLERRVALRLIPSTHEDGTPYSRARLLRETRSMARLSHPNVIQIYDVGATRRELFIAMELLDGESVRSWIDRASPAWADVLATFVDAGRGLVAAHDAGLVHGDFDSRYVQRTESGRVVVTDFGLTRARTRAGGLNSGGSDARLVRDDQYAFCAALYEALFHEDAPASVSDLEQRPSVRDADVPKPVIRALVRGLGREHRFGSMKGLLSALEPRSGRRMWVILGATAVFGGAAALAYGLVGLGDDSHCATDALPPGSDAVARAAAVRKLRDSAPAHGTDSARWVGTHLDAWADSWAQTWSAECRAGAHDPSPCLLQQAAQARGFVAVLSAQPEGASIHAAAGVLELPNPSRCASDDGAPATATPEFDAAWSRAWAHVALGDPQTAVGQLQPLIHDTTTRPDLRLRALALLGRAQASAGSPQAASRSLREALDEKNLPRQERSSLSLLLARVLAQELGRPDQARAVLEANRSAFDASDESPRLRSEFFALDAALAQEAGDLESARELYAQAESVLADRGDAERLLAASAALRRGTFEVSVGDYREAMRHFRRAQRERTELLGLSHPWVAEALAEVAGAWIGEGELVAARDTLETAVAIFESTYPRDHPTMLQTRGRLALLLGLTGRIETSLTMFEDVITRETKRSGENSDPVANYLSNRAVLLLEADRVDDAKADLDRALAIRTVLGDNDARASVLGQLANVAMKRDDPRTAERLTREALQLHETALGTQHPRLSPSLVVLGNALSEQPGREEEARAALDRALAIVEATQGPDHANAAFALAGLGQLDARSGDQAKARTRLTRAIELLERADYGADLEMRARLALAAVEWSEGHKDRSIETARAALRAAQSREPAAVPTIEAWLREHGAPSTLGPDSVE